MQVVLVMYYFMLFSTLPVFKGVQPGMSTVAGAVPHVKFLVPLLLNFIKINSLLELMESMVIPFCWDGFWPIVVAGRR